MPAAAKGSRGAGPRGRGAGADTPGVWQMAGRAYTGEGCRGSFHPPLTHPSAHLPQGGPRGTQPCQYSILGAGSHLSTALCSPLGRGLRVGTEVGPVVCLGTRQGAIHWTQGQEP